MIHIYIILYYIILYIILYYIISYHIILDYIILYYRYICIICIYSIYIYYMYTVDNADFLGCLQLSTPTIPCTTAEARKIRGGRSISLKSSALDLGRKNRDLPKKSPKHIMKDMGISGISLKKHLVGWWCGVVLSYHGFNETSQLYTQWLDYLEFKTRPRVLLLKSLGLWGYIKSRRWNREAHHDSRGSKVAMHSPNLWIRQIFTFVWKCPKIGWFIINSYKFSHQNDHLKVLCFPHNNRG